MQHAVYTDILVKFRPMNPLTVAKNLKMDLRGSQWVFLCTPC